MNSRIGFKILDSENLNRIILEYFIILFCSSLDLSEKLELSLH